MFAPNQPPQPSAAHRLLARRPRCALLSDVPTRFFSFTASLGTALVSCALVAFFPARDTRSDSLDRFGAAASPLEVAREQATQVLAIVVAAALPAGLSPTIGNVADRQSLGTALADYANNPGTDPEHFETFIEAAKRIVAGGTTAKRSPDATSRWLDQTADAILAAVRAAEQSAGGIRSRDLDAFLAELRVHAQLARFHARRFIAAVHYNLFKRSLRLGELYAATLQEQKAVAAWRELVAVSGSHPLAAHWRRELKNLEFTLKELEDQCCPPDEAILKEKVWQPATS